MRAFLAVPVEEPALTPLQSLLGGLRAAVSDVRWVRDGGLHLTVHFFGDVSEERAAVACDAVRPVATARQPFAVRFDRVGDFNDGAVLWCGIADGTDDLTTFALACRDALTDAGFECEMRRYRAHCTLGRSGQRRDATSHAAWMSAGAAVAELPAFTARRLVLFESRLVAGGTEHVPRRELAFR